MTALTPVDAASCRAMAIECGRRAQALATNREFVNARAQIERARELCVLALKFEQEDSQAKASEDNGGNSAVGSAPMTGEASRASVGAGTDATNSPERATSFSSLNSFSGIGSARETSAMPHPGVVDGPTASLAGRDSGDSVERHAPIPPSDGDAISEVKGIARPENAVGVESPPSGTHSLPPVPLTAASPALSLPGASGTYSRADAGASIIVTHQDIRS